MSGRLELKVVFAAIDKFARPVKAITAAASAAAKALRDNTARMKEFNRTVEQIDAFKKAGANAAITANAFTATRRKIDELKAAMDKVGVPTKAMAAEMAALSRKSEELKAKHESLTNTEQRLFEKLKASGIDTRNLAEHRRQLASASAEATNASRHLQTALDAENQKMRRLHAAQADLAKARERAGKIAGIGAGLAAGGAVMAVPVKSEIDEAKRYVLETARIKALGLGDHAAADAVKFSRAMQTYGTSARDNLELVRDAMTVFADEHHAQMVAPLLAKMKFANAAMYGDQGGEDTSRKFMDMLKVIELRGGLASEQRFKHEADLVQQVLTATGGRVGPEQWMAFIRTGGLAAKGLDDKSFYYRMEPLVQEMGGFGVGTGLMSAYQNLYQGKTTVRAARYAESLGLYDKKMVEYDKIGQLKRVKPGALQGGAVFKSNPLEWIETVMLPAMAKQGITDDEQIKDAIGTLFSNRTASNLVAQMYLQRAQIKKNERLNAGAADIDTLAEQAKQTPQGQELDLLARKRNLYLDLGTSVLPLYVRGLELARDALQGVTGWMERNPALAKSMAIGFAGLAVGAVALGSLTLAAAAVLGPLALLRFSLTTIGLSTGPLAATLGAVLMPIAKLVAAFGVGYAAGTLLNEVLNRGISYIVGYETTLGGAIFDLVQKVKGGGSQLIDWFAALPARMTSAGAEMINGLIAGITSRMEALRLTVSSAADGAVGWVKEKLGIRSPSRVFAELGAYTMQGFEQGIADGEAGALAALASTTKKLTALAAGFAITIPTLANATELPAPPDHADFPLPPKVERIIGDHYRGIDLPKIPDITRQIIDVHRALPALDDASPIERSPAPMKQAGAGAAHHEAATYHITISAPPGADNQNLAALVSREIERIEAGKSAQRRSRLRDMD